MSESQPGIAPAADTTEFEVGGAKVAAHNDNLFARVRAKHSVDRGFLTKFDFGSLRMFGGKGGNPMAFTTDKRYLVKEISSGDHQSLLKNTEALVNRLLTGDSLICPMFLHFTHGGQDYIVMRNCLPTGSAAIWHKRYDIKGNRDDKLLEEDGEAVREVHKRCFAFWTCWYGCDVLWPCNTPARQRYYKGKREAFSTTFVVSEAQSARIISMIKGDTDLLHALGVMDYSLVLGIVRQGQAEPIPPADGLNQFVMHDEGWTYIYYMGIIDFLQEWTTTKKIAACIKAPCAPKPLSTVPPPKYADQFFVALERKFKTTPLEMYRT